MGMINHLKQKSSKNIIHFDGARERVSNSNAIYLPYSKKLVVASAIAQTHHHIRVLTLIVRKAPRNISKLWSSLHNKFWSIILVPKWLNLDQIQDQVLVTEIWSILLIDKLIYFCHYWQDWNSFVDRDTWGHVLLNPWEFVLWLISNDSYKKSPIRSFQWNGFISRNIYIWIKR